MDPLNWQTVEEKFQVPGKPPAGIWTKVLEYVNGPRKLCFEVAGNWSYSPRHECGPDGNRNEGGIADLLVPSAPVGAVIGKIGGSSADRVPPPGAVIFVVGSFCVIEIPPSGVGGPAGVPGVAIPGGGAVVSGALFLTMNDRIDRFDQHSGTTLLRLREADAAARNP
jgi:hypothetical protein